MSALSDGDRLPYEIGILIALARRSLWTAAAHELEANGFSMLVWVLLAHLVRNGSSTQRRIAAATGQHPAGVSRMLVELEEEKLVRRGRDQEDRRRAKVELTAAGRRRFEAGRPHVIGALRKALGPLTPAEMKTLRGVLSKLCPGMGIELGGSAGKKKPAVR